MDQKKYNEYLSYLTKMMGTDEIPISQSEMVENYLLPRFVRVFGSKNQQCIQVSDEFMNFMADWGQYCFSLDRKENNAPPYTTFSLMLIAMQRILNGAVYYDKSFFQNTLVEFPGMYGRYAELPYLNMPMNKACWRFLDKNLSFCLHSVGALADISKIVLCCLLRNLNATNNVSVTAQGYVWNEQKIGISLRNAYFWAQSLALKYFGVQWCCSVLAPVWREKMYFFRKYREFIDWADAEKYFPFNDEKYYTGLTRIVLKMLFLYKPMTMQNIKKEIFSA